MSRYTQQDQYTVGGLNAENESIEQAIADTLSRKGDTPNAMETTLDMNSNRIINLVKAINDHEPATFGQLKQLATDGVIEQIIKSPIQFYRSVEDASIENNSDYEILLIVPEGTTIGDDSASIFIKEDTSVDYTTTTSSRIVDTSGNRFRHVYGLNKTLESYHVSDSIMSWWAKPCYLRHNNKSYFAFSKSSGAVGVAVIDHTTNEVSSYQLDDNFLADDHNTGAITAGDGKVLVFFPGRRRTDTSDAFFSIYFEWNEDDTPLSAPKQEVEIGRNYPNTYNVDGDFLGLFQQDVVGASAGQWGYRLNTWPLSTWGDRKAFFQSTNEWPYFATRRSRTDYKTINLALGWHPENQPIADIRVGKIVHNGTANPWDLVVDGSVAGNLDGTNLPIDETALELAYEAATNEKTRLMDVHENCFTFVSYEAADGSDSVHKYSRKVNGTWVTNTIAASGKPMEESPGVFYFGGSCIDDDDVNVVYTSENRDGRWWWAKYKTEDNGATWSLVQEVDPTKRSGSQVVVGRPTAEVRSEFDNKQGANYKTNNIAFAGRYDPTNYANFNTSVFTFQGLASNGTLQPWERNGATTASSGSTALNHMAFVGGSLSCQAIDRVTGIVGSRRIEARGVGTFVGGSKDSEVNGDSAVILGSNTSECGDSNTQFTGIYSSRDCRVFRNDGGIYNSTSSTVINGERNVLIGARGITDSNSSNRISGGVVATNVSSTGNRKWEIDSLTGDLYLAGSVTSPHSFADTAKMIANGEQQEIQAGYLVSLFGDKVFKAKQGEYVFGIIAATPSRIDNNTPFTWKGRYLTDDFGRYITEDVAMVKWDEYDGPVAECKLPFPDDALHYSIKQPKENPEYDNSLDNTPRRERPDEWSCVGVEGLLRVRVDNTVTQTAVDNATEQRSNVYVTPSVTEGVGCLTIDKTNVQVMSVEKEYDQDKGYGVALCFLNQG